MDQAQFSPSLVVTLILTFNPPLTRKGNRKSSTLPSNLTSYLSLVHCCTPPHTFLPINHNSSQFQASARSIAPAQNTPFPPLYLSKAYLSSTVQCNPDRHHQSFPNQSMFSLLTLTSWKGIQSMSLPVKKPMASKLSTENRVDSSLWQALSLSWEAHCLPRDKKHRCADDIGVYTKEERFKLATDTELYQVSVFLGKEKKYLIRIRGRNPPPLMEMTAPGMPGPETKRQELSRRQSC